MKTFSHLVLALIFLGMLHPAYAQDMQRSTYCNPINIDYTYMVYNANQGISYRSGADPAVVEFKNEYYMFVTRSMGYWHSTDLTHWDFITPEKWYFQGSNAPAAFNYKDSILYVTGDPSGSMSILYTDDPKKGDWKATPSILNGLQDPALFIDDDGQAYMFWGSSNKFPIRVEKLDKANNFKPGEKHELFNLKEDEHGWERFGENNSDTAMEGYIEGAWMTKYKGTYYLQYAAPGTEFNVYGDGVYTSKNPLGPYQYAANNPFSFKPGGFINGAGHGSTVLGPGEQYWHFATMSVSLNINWERRIGMFPVFFDEDGLLHCNNYFGDYPHYSPDIAEKMGEFTGWMLLSYDKPVKASSFLEGYSPKNLVDESVKTYWVAQENNDRQWIEIDLEKPGKVYAIQVNYNDYHSDLYGRIPGLYYRYVVEGSVDGDNWIKLVDRSDSYEDTPNDYVELSVPQTVRYIRYKNIHVPTPYLSVSDIRIFGIGQGKRPKQVKKLQAERYDNGLGAKISWEKQTDVQGYNVLWGIAPNKLYHSWMIYGENKLDLRALNAGQTYYFSVEAFNESGVGKRSDVIKVE